MEGSNSPDFSSRLQEFHTLNDKEYEDFLELSSFFDYTPDLLCIAGFDAMFKKVNPAVFKLLGYSREELFSHPINYFVHPDDQERTSKAREGLFDGEPLLNFENRYITKNGSVVWLSWTSIPVPNNQSVFAIAKDITLKKRLEEEKNELYDNLVQINKELEHFTRIASHDLRSPINNILSLFDLIDFDKIPDEQTKMIFEMIKSSTQKVYQTLEKYIEELKKKDRVPITDQNLKDILETVTSSIHLLIKRSEAQIETDFSAFEVVRFNREYLESIFLNLLTNAIKYADEHRKPLIRIKTRINSKGKNQLLVSDNGIGIDLKKHKNNIFGLNQTFHQRPDSTGLGLFLIQSHLSEMGGKIEVESEVGKGTTFIITFKE